MNTYSKKILFVSLALLVFGVLAMYSVSIYESFTVTKGGSNYFYFQEHLQKIAIGIFLCIITRSIPRKIMKKRDIVIFVGSFIFLLLLFSPLGDNQLNNDKDARLWLFLPGQTLQPGEFFKLGYVFFLSNRMIRKRNQFNEIGFFLWSIFLIWLLCITFVFLPDFGTTLILWIVGLILYRYVWGKIYYVLIATLLWLWVITMVESKIPYIHNRIAYYLDPSKDKTTGIGYQTTNALVSIGWWGIWGRGYGKWLQKFWNLPESQSDFIFAAFLEEIGLLWWIVLLTLYVLLARYSYKWITSLEDEHDKILWFWILSLIMVQAFVNMGVNSNLLPLTGLTLPFISHGWSALLANMIEVTILAKIITNGKAKILSSTKFT